MTTCSMSVSLEQADGTEGTGGDVREPPPQPCKPKDASSATVVAAPSFSSSRRVKFCMALRPKALDALFGAKVGYAINSWSAYRPSPAGLRSFVSEQAAS